MPSFLLSRRAEADLKGCFLSCYFSHFPIVTIPLSYRQLGAVTKLFWILNKDGFKFNGSDFITKVVGKFQWGDRKGRQLGTLSMFRRTLSAMAMTMPETQLMRRSWVSGGNCLLCKSGIA